MSAVAQSDAGSVILDNLADLCRSSLTVADALALAVKARVACQVVVDGRVDRRKLEAHQALAHGFSWITTYIEALRQLLGWAERLDAAGQFGELEALILQAGYGNILRSF